MKIKKYFFLNLNANFFAGLDGLAGLKLITFISAIMGFIMTTNVALGQDKKKEIPPKDFYAAALQSIAPIASFKETAQWLKQGSVILIDLRSKEEFNASHIKNAISVPATELTDETLEKFIPNKDSRVVIYCANNFSMSRKVSLTTLAYPTLKQLGYKNVYVLEAAWSNHFPLPLDPPQKPPIEPNKK